MYRTIQQYAVEIAFTYVNISFHRDYHAGFWDCTQQGEISFLMYHCNCASNPKINTTPVQLKLHEK